MFCYYVWGSRDGKFKYYIVLGCDAVLFGRYCNRLFDLPDLGYNYL